MGIYLNPRSVTKREFLEQFATEITQEEFLAFPFGGNSEYAPICAVRNPTFVAIGVADVYEEAYIFSMPDKRPKMYFKVKKEDLIQHGGIREEAIETVKNI